MTKTDEELVAPTFCEVATGEIVKIKIGSEQKVYRVYKDLICYHSEYFRTAYNGKWSEAEHRVTLADVEPEVFNVFIYWMFASDLPDSSFDIARIAGTTFAKDESDNGCKYGRLLMVKACVFGDRFLAPCFRMAMHNLYIMGTNKSAYYEEIIYAFDNLNEDDPLLRFMVEAQCIQWRAAWDEEEKEEERLRVHLPVKFLVKVMLRLSELNVAAGSEVELDACAYHIHSTTEQKESCPDFRGHGGVTNAG